LVRDLHGSAAPCGWRLEAVGAPHGAFVAGPCGQGPSHCPSPPRRQAKRGMGHRPMGHHQGSWSVIGIAVTMKLRWASKLRSPALKQFPKEGAAIARHLLSFFINAFLTKGAEFGLSQQT